MPRFVFSKRRQNFGSGRSQSHVGADAHDVGLGRTTLDGNAYKSTRQNTTSAGDQEKEMKGSHAVHPSMQAACKGDSSTSMQSAVQRKTKAGTDTSRILREPNENDTSNLKIHSSPEKLSKQTTQSIHDTVGYPPFNGLGEATLKSKIDIVMPSGQQNAPSSCDEGQKAQRNDASHNCSPAQSMHKGSSVSLISNFHEERTAEIVETRKRSEYAENTEKSQLSFDTGAQLKPSNKIHGGSDSNHGRGSDTPYNFSFGAATARISNIESSTTEDEFRLYLESKGLSLSDGQSEFSFTRTESGCKLATVSFTDEITLKKALSLPRIERRLKSRTLNFDAEFDGITVLSEPENAQVDIVALHGMNGHAFSSWEYRDNSGYGFMWLRDCLHERIPKGRIMVYGYNANVVSDVSTGRIRTYAETFLEKLLYVRKRNQVDDRPLILIGHSLGGLIIKRALLVANTRADDRFDSILNSVGGVVFVGTPHRGLNGVDTSTFIANFMGVFRVAVNARDDLIAEQHPNSMVLFDLTNDFRELIAAKSIGVATVFEAKKTKYKDLDPVWIVDETSAVLGVAGERKVSIDKDHIHMCKFEDSEDDSLGAMIQPIQELCGDVVPVIAFRNITTQPSLPKGLKYRCLTHPDKLDSAPLYPVLVLGKYTYWALSYTDDRLAMAILAYDNKQRMVNRWCKKGARYVHRIEYLEVEGFREVSFVGEHNQAVGFRLAELKVTNP